MAVKEVSDYRKRLYSLSQNSETSFSCTVHVQGQEHLFAIFKRKMVKFSYKVLNFTRNSWFLVRIKVNILHIELSC